ncbi:MAG TPA: hypothetical protein VGO58_20475 [Chitinophagaceae bacterium]|nr:hypothetical protein [Chitinophagaceae bacterium]
MKKLPGILFILVLSTALSSAQGQGNIQGVRRDRIVRPSRPALRKDMLRLNLNQRNGRREEVSIPIKKRKRKCARLNTRSGVVAVNAF